MIDENTSELIHTAFQSVKEDTIKQINKLHEKGLLTCGVGGTVAEDGSFKLNHVSFNISGDTL